MTTFTTRTAVRQALVTARNGDNAAMAAAIDNAIRLIDADVALRATVAGVQTAGNTAITDALTSGSATAANCATTINLILDALRAKGMILAS
jgi:hypothetical protein